MYIFMEEVFSVIMIITSQRTKKKVCIAKQENGRQQIEKMTIEEKLKSLFHTLSFDKWC